jgi:hypothetical protein
MTSFFDTIDGGKGEKGAGRGARLPPVFPHLPSNLVEIGAAGGIGCFQGYGVAGVAGNLVFCIFPPGIIRQPVPGAVLDGGRRRISVPGGKTAEPFTDTDHESLK